MSSRRSSSSQSKSLLYPLFRKANEIQNNNNDDAPLNLLANGRKAKRRKTSSHYCNDNAAARSSKTSETAAFPTKQSTVPISSSENKSELTDTYSSDTSSDEKEQAAETSHYCENAAMTQDDQSSESETDTNQEKDRLYHQRNIIHQLIHRSTTGRRLQNPPAAHKQWSPWAVLDTSNAVVTCTAWDAVGVLLAVACRNKTLRIYDWDVVRVRSRQSVEPMCTFSTPHVVTSMQWDTHDCVAMTFRGSSHVRVYDVARLVESCNNDSCYTTLQYAAIRSEAVTLQHLPRKQWLVSHRDGHVLLYKCKSSGATLQWKWRNNHDVFTKIVPLINTTVLLVGQARWIHLDWKQCTRLVFSTEETPTVLQRWGNTGNTQYGSVQSLQVLSKLPLQCKWITSNGWILTMNLDRDSTPRVVHGPPRVLLQTTSSIDGLDSKRESTQHYSQPLQPVAAYSTPELHCWETVSPVTHVLPHHDRRNVGGSLQVVRSSKRSLSIMDVHDRIEQVSMKSCLVSTVTMHSSNEWLVVGNAKDGGLRVWTARKLPKRQKETKRQC